MKSIKDIKDFSGKKVLLRVDLNCSIDSKGKVIENSRIKRHSETIKYLSKKGARIVILAHQGSPGKKDFVSLNQHSRFLNKYVKVKFNSDTDGKEIHKKINLLNKGEALLLENIRFSKDEFRPSVKNKISLFFRKVGFDYFISDAFSIAHRDQTSVTILPKLFTPLTGLVMEEEIRNITKLRSKLKNSLMILGGVKVKDIISLIKKGRVLPTGKLVLLNLIVNGKNLGLENKNLESEIKEFSNEIKNSKMPLALDLAVKSKGKRIEKKISEFPLDKNILDIGNKTIEMYVKEIKKAKSIFLKGSIGKIEEKGFEKGSREILKAISKSKAFSVISGGSSSDAIDKFRLSKKDFGYVSLSGGSLVAYLSGKKLPGLEALK